MAVNVHGAIRDNFSIIPNELFRTQLPPRCVYVLGNLLTHNSDYNVHISTIAEQTGLSRKTIGSALNDLEQLGLIRRSKTNGGHGEFDRNDYDFYPERLVSGGWGKITEGKNYPRTGVKFTHGPGENLPTKNITLKNQDKEDQSAPGGAHGYPEGFEEFFLEYPRKSDKRGALKRYREQLEVTDHNTLMRSVKNFRAEMERLQTEQRYIPMCKTWLNQGRWRDFVDYAPKKSGKEKLDQALSWLEEM